MSISQRISLVLLLTLTVFSTSCMKAAVKGLMVNSEKANKLFIHKNPKVGDYSVKQSTGDTGTMKVIAVSSDFVTVRWESAAVPDLISEWVLDFEGNVKKVDMIDAARNYERIPCRILKPGDTQYLEPVKLTKEQLAVAMMLAPVEIKNLALDYKSELEGYKIKPAGKDYYSIYLTDKNVKFLVVSSFLVIHDKVYSYERLIDSGNKK